MRLLDELQSVEDDIARMAEGMRETWGMRIQNEHTRYDRHGIVEWTWSYAAEGGGLAKWSVTLDGGRDVNARYTRPGLTGPARPLGAMSGAPETIPEQPKGWEERLGHRLAGRDRPAVLPPSVRRAQNDEPEVAGGPPSPPPRFT